MGVLVLLAAAVVVVVVRVFCREQYPKYTPDARSVCPATERPDMGMLAVGMPSYWK